MQDIVEEALEDIAVARAIKQGLETKSVSRKKDLFFAKGLIGDTVELIRFLHRRDIYRRFP